MNGIGRIYDHVRNKDFWTYCVLFVTDNNSFDKLAIDYLEYEFIKKLKKSSYILMNKDLRSTEPNISIYDKPNILAYIVQIEFLLNAEGVVLDAINEESTSINYYHPASKKYNAKLFVKDGKFILTKDSTIKRPLESSKNWKSDKFYTRLNSQIDDYIRDGKVEEKDGEIILTVSIAFGSPSRAGALVTGRPVNGWDFFKNLNELRVLDEEGK